MNEPIFANADKGLCIVCGMPTTITGRMTCTLSCHQSFVKFCEEKFGKVKKVIDETTGIQYKVPTSDIIERGLAWEDLPKYPVWNDKDD